MPLINYSLTQTNQIQSSVIKTMILVSALYALSDLPISVYYLMLNVHANLTLLESGYYASLVISYLYFCSIGARREVMVTPK